MGLLHHKGLNFHIIVPICLPSPSSHMSTRLAGGTSPVPLTAAAPPSGIKPSTRYSSSRHAGKQPATSTTAGRGESPRSSPLMSRRRFPTNPPHPNSPTTGSRAQSPTNNGSTGSKPQQQADHVSGVRRRKVLCGLYILSILLCDIAIYRCVALLLLPLR